MTPAERFLVRAAECERMSKFTDDKTNKVFWRHMAERWKRFAEIERKNERWGTKHRIRRKSSIEERLH
jgi:hypothetical protein